MHAKFSPEQRLIGGLAELGCSGRSFSAIAGVSKTRFAYALDGKQELSHEEAARLLQVLQDMRELAALSQAGLNWEDTETIHAALEERRRFKAALLTEVSRVCGQWSDLVTRGR
jgi:hypothetical protein